MLTQQDIIDFCNQYDYDVRKTHNGRWIDQKCAADVVTVISDCILNYSFENPDQTFTTLDIWHYKYAVENVEDIFRKPGVESTKAKNEYDKFFQQPMKMLAHAHVLKEYKMGNKNIFSVENAEILEYIALRERNALFFLKTYIEKVLNDSGIMYLFDDFFKHQTSDYYQKMKSGFSQFTISNTRINGVTECNRIFIKVVNPLAYFNHCLGTEGGRISKQNITYDMLMYNRNNFRDIYSEKPKGVTRKEYVASHPVEVNDAYYKYQSSKAKRFLRMFNDAHRNGLSEHIENGYMQDKAIHMHHIFPEAMYPEICYLYENIIALTPTQHLNYAHPNGHTQEIDEQYQHLLLLSKTDRIRENLTVPTEEKIYDFSNLLYVLNIGFDNDDVLDIEDMDFSSVVNMINSHY